MFEIFIIINNNNDTIHSPYNVAYRLPDLEFISLSGSVS